jgi:cytochrome c oxidase subunit 3
MTRQRDHAAQPEHVGLRHSPALALDNGTVCLWLFLCTELVFFFALVGSCLVIRYGPAASASPSPNAVPWSAGLGFIVTAVLLVSSVTVALSIKAARVGQNQRAKRWLLTTVILGILFLGIRAYEYHGKLALGMAAWPRGLIYEQADVYYAAAVREALTKKKTELESRRAEAGSLSELDQNRLTVCNVLLGGMVQWAEATVATADDPAAGQAALTSLADAVYPGRETDRRAEWKRESTELPGRRDELATRQYRLLREQTELGRSSGAATDVGKRMGQIASELTVVGEAIQRIDDRRKALALLQEAEQGLNHAFAEQGGLLRPWLTLPIVLPGGHRWAVTYSLLTGFHALHVLVGLVVLVPALVSALDTDQACRLENAGRYWHFVTGIGILVFPLLHLA